METFEKDMSEAQQTGQPVVPVIIDSYGGVVYGLLGMISAIEQCSIPVATILTSKAMSAGAILFCFGTEGYRFMDKNACMMIHDAGCMSQGKVEDIKADTKHLDHLNQSLYIAAPGLCSHDVVHRISRDGLVDVFFKGLGRPQGLAFDDRGSLYIAACLRGRHGIVKISEDGSNAELWLAGMSIVGLCFDGKGRVVVATEDSLYRLNTETYGTLV